MDFEQNYNNNMEFLKKYWPHVCEKIQLADISAYELIIDSDDEINVAVNDHKLYPKDVDQAISNQVDTFLQNPTSYYRKPSWCHDTKRGYYHDTFIRDLENSSPYIAEKKIFSGYSHNLEGFIPILLIFGIGTGKHIEKLVKNSEISDLIIVDESYEFLKISMHLLDWSNIFKYFTQNNRTLHFIIHHDPQENAHSLLNTIFGNFPYYFFNIYFMTHYESDFFNKVKDTVLDKINLGITGLGFYDDEVIGLKHTIENISKNMPIFKHTNQLPEGSAALIIGSGPSIDQDIETIKTLQDKVIVFSCGTSLKILYENNIVPDFHIEQERPPDQCDRIINNFPTEYLKKINIIGLNVVAPKMFELFKSAKVFFRVNDAGGSIAPDNIKHLEHCNPTVVNATCAFASEIGFDNIFLFGADMGYKDPENHHSKSSDYYKGSLTNWKPDTIGQKYPGNFDKEEMLYTTDIFLWCKQRIENCIYEYNIKDKKSINYYNCSDGLAIERSTPLHSNKIHLNTTLDKELILKGIENSFDKDFQTIHEELYNNFLEQKQIINEDISSLKKLIKSKKIKSFSQFFTLVKRCFFIINHLNEKDKSFISRSMLKGTTFHFIVSVFTHALAGSNKDDSLKYINESLNKYLEFLEVAQKDINQFETLLIK